MINWHVGMTTGQGRSKIALSVIEQIRKAGWDSVEVFADGEFESSIVHRRPYRLGSWRNWISGLFQLYVSCESDYYVMFEDDILLCHNIRGYLERLLPTLGEFLAISLYNPDNPHKYLSFNCIENVSWLGTDFWGTQCIVFSRSGLSGFLTNTDVIEFRGDRHRDSILGRYALQEKKVLYCHSPSLVEHISDHSTIGNDIHHAKDFVGENFDALKLSPRVVRDPYLH